MNSCEFSECERARHARGLCVAHYRQHERGTPLRPIKETMHGLSVEEKIDRLTEPGGGGCLVWTGPRDPGGYGAINHGGVRRPAHRVVWELANGRIPEGMLLDHKCGVRRCVEVDHLRVASRSENNQYRTVPQSTNTSGHRGVTYFSQTGRWAASAQKNGRKHHLGYYSTAEEASEVAKAWREANYSFGDFDARPRDLVFE